MFAAVVIVRVTVDAVVPFSETLVGLKLQTAPAGRPAVQPPAGEVVGLKLTVPVKPATGVIVIVVVAVCPAGTLSEGGTGVIV
jgi:hypothetical protein